LALIERAAAPHPDPLPVKTGRGKRGSHPPSRRWDEGLGNGLKDGQRFKLRGEGIDRWIGCVLEHVGVRLTQKPQRRCSRDIRVPDALSKPIGALRHLMLHFKRRQDLIPASETSDPRIF
jgi:hypothetical protein